MKKGRPSVTKKKITLTALLIAGVLSLFAFLFVQDVSRQLWRQSVNTIRESTRQGLNTLQVQLRREFETIGAMALRLKAVPSTRREVLENDLANYSMLDEGTRLYLEDGTCYPTAEERDEAATDLLFAESRKSGILDPHISSVTGVNVFDLYVRVTFQDGCAGYLVKEYEVEDIVDSFSLSFYDDAGFSYVVDVDGDVLIRPPHPNSNKTVQNLFDILSASENDAGILNEFARALQDRHSGWAVFAYQEEDTVFCYVPLQLESDWYLISIIPKNVVDAQTTHILTRSLALIVSILAGIALLAYFYLRYARRANERLRRQADYIGHLYNAVPEGIALIGVTQPYPLLQLNKEGLRMLDYPQENPGEAPLNKSLQDLLFPDDYEALSRVLAVAEKQEKKNTFAVRVHRRGGSLFWAAGIVERTLDENGVPVLIAAFHDVTDQKLAEEEAAREQLQERILLVSAISSVYPVIISMNLSRDTIKFIYLRSGLMVHMGGQTSYTQLYDEIRQSVHPKDRDEFEHRLAPRRLREVLGKEKNEVFVEAKLLLDDGQYHWTSTQIIQVEDPYSADGLAVLISRRIDEQKYEEERQKQALQSALDNARAASRAKSRFLSNMSHDIRTPMNAILGMTAIAQAHLDDRQRVEECLRKVDLSGKHLLSLINDVLDMSKVESGKLTIKREPFNFAELVTEAAELVRPQAKAHELTLEVRPALLKNERVVGDPLRIRQVLVNVLSNAVKYTPSGGAVYLEFWQEECARKGYQRYGFRCEDTGLGMDKTFLERLFQPFERAADSAVSQVVGTGLGMAITKNLVDLMDGSIEVESEPGKGSVFTIAFPLEVQDAPQDRVPREWLGARSLVVDDDIPVRENVVELLNTIGLRAEPAADGRDAVRRVLDAQKGPDPFALLIVDWRMPDLDGIEVARRVRAQIGEKVPVVILTANEWAESEAEAKTAGVTAFLSKPFYQSKLCYLLSELSRDTDREKEEPKAAGEAFAFPDKRVLLVEDNELNREIARTLIEEHGIQVEEACDGVEAVEKFSLSEPGYYDLILMDVQMPRLDGYGATKKIRALDRPDAERIPIVAMTANAFEEDQRDARQAGMNAHFAKPIDARAFDRLLYGYFSPSSHEN